MSEQITILVTGDFCPQLRVEKLILEKRYDLIYNDFKSELENNDLTIVDLECPLIAEGKKVAKTGPNLKARPEAVGALSFANVNLVAMANNHIMDYGGEGMLSTIDTCRNAGIATVGVGKNLTEARKPFVITIKGRKIAVLNFTENEWSNTHGDQPGANPLDLVKNFRDIREARDTADFVLVVFHGGNEFYELPSPRLKETLRFFADAGASAVVAHHTHTISGYEVYKDTPIFYSIGNFCFDWQDQRNSFWNVGFAVRLKIAEHVSFEVLPFKQNDTNPGIFRLTEEETKRFDEKIHHLSMIIADDAKLKAKFDEYCKSKAYVYNLYLEPYRNQWLAALRKRKLIPSFFSRQKKRLLLNITRCEAHRDVLLKYLSD
jgi:poly-gamma-glutamate capsule biosynthesis protein CapA/YwtB (metallophosphatase superfamily)